MSTTKRKISDLGSPDIERHHSVRLEIADLSGAARARVQDSSILDGILLKGWISVADYDTLSKLQSDIIDAGLIGLRAQDYQPRSPSANHNISHEQAIKRLSVNEAILWMDKKVGKPTRRLVVDTLMDIAKPSEAQAHMLTAGAICLRQFWDHVI